MDEPRQHDGDSLTDQVRLFRRMARVAAADPLRLLPTDALARLASLAAPAAALIELAPFERLRDAVSAPTATARRETPRTRAKPFAAAGNDILRTAAAAAAAPVPRAAGPQAASTAAPPEPASTSSSLQLAGAALRRAAGPTSLADRRAALRRRQLDTEPPATASALVRQEAAATGSRSTSTIEARDVNVPARGRKPLHEEIASLRRRVTSVPPEAGPIDRDNVASVSGDPPSAAVARAATHAPSTTEERRTSALPDRLSASTPQTAMDPPIERDVPAALPRSEASDPGSGLSQSSSWPMSGRWPQAAPTPQADAAGSRRRAWEPESDSELADSLFETLYRDGVDLPWP